MLSNHSTVNEVFNYLCDERIDETNLQSASNFWEQLIVVIYCTTDKNMMQQIKGKDLQCIQLTSWHDSIKDEEAPRIFCVCLQIRKRPIISLFVIVGTPSDATTAGRKKVLLILKSKSDLMVGCIAGFVTLSVETVLVYLWTEHPRNISWFLVPVCKLFPRKGISNAMSF